METNAPWPQDPTPGEMAYVAVCQACDGLTFICSTEHLATHMSALMVSIRNGDALHRVSIPEIIDTRWHFCHCRRDESEKHIFHVEEKHNG